MSTAQELASRTVDEALPVILSAVDMGIAAVSERACELVGDLPDGDDGFWADGTERANLVRIANLAVLGLARGAATKGLGAGLLAPDDMANGAHLTGRYVATVSTELGVNYQDLYGAQNALGPIFSRYAAYRRTRIGNAQGSPHP